MQEILFNTRDFVYFQPMLFNSFLLVFISELGDKTQLLALVLAARFKQPVPIMLGILVATLLNHGLASLVGSHVSSLIDPQILRWILGATFILFGIWILLPDKDEGLKDNYKWGPFLTTTVAFFLAEMGDKTQLATLALGAKFNDPWIVTTGTTLGMLAADGLAVFFGQRFTDRIPMSLIRKIACALFIAFGILILLQTSF